MGWKPVHETAEMVDGRLYRASWTIQSPFPAHLLRSGCDVAVKGIDAIYKPVKVEKITWIAPDQLPSIRAGRYDPWMYEVEFRKLPGGGTPIAVVIGLIVAGLGVLFLGWTISNHTLEELVDTTGEAVAKAGGTVSALIPLVGVLIVAGTVFRR